MEKRTVDCLIIGTGMGGSSAAALLAHYGYKVLVAEKRDQVGGRFSTQILGGFKCPTGALIIQRGTELEETFKVTGAKFELSNCSNISWKIGDEIYPLLGKGLFTKTIPAAIKNFRWRHYKFGLMTILMIMKALLGTWGRDFVNLFRGEDNKLVKKPAKGGISYRDWMERYTADEKIMQANHAIISSLFTGTNDFECPAEDVFEFYASQANPTKSTKFGYAPRGNIELIKNLIKVVTDKGNEVLMETEVKRIKQENGKAIGAILICMDGQEIDVDARIVISNSGPRQTMEMAGQENYPAPYVADLKEQMRPIPIVMGLIESDVPLLDKKGLVVITGTNAIVTGVTLTLHSDEIGPPGKHLLWTCGTPINCTDHVDKEEEIRRNEEDMAKAFPLYRKHGRVLKWVVKDIDDDLPVMRTWPGYDLPVYTPISNLYDVGDGVKEPGWCGSPACAKSAWMVVDLVRKRILPPSKAA